MAGNRIKQTLSKLSLGFVLIMVWGWMWVRADILFPTHTAEWRLGYFLTNILFVAFIFSFDTISGSKTEKSMFRLSFIEEFPKALISAAISFAILYGFGFLVNKGSMTSIGQAIWIVGIGVIITQALMQSIFEELIFRGWIPEQLKARKIRKSIGIFIATVIFALYHAGMGKSLFVMLMYIPLGLLFYAIKMKFSPNSNMANAGVHFAWNLFILGFMQ